MKFKTALTLDKAKWICGYPRDNEREENCMGRGHVELLNKEGFQCCLGQWATQVNPAITQEMIYCKTSPFAVNAIIEGLSVFNSENDEFENTSFSKEAMDINDDKDTTVEKKIELLTALCNKYDFDLQVIDSSLQ